MTFAYLFRHGIARRVDAENISITINTSNRDLGEVYGELRKCAACCPVMGRIKLIIM